MNDRYHRNRIYLDKSEQEIIKNCPIIFGGCGIGSIIAECALRLGFEHITIIDGDQVELSNLNRQNYTENDITANKTQTLKSRLLSINAEATINIYDGFISQDNAEELIAGHQIAINAIDFTSDIPIRFDEICREQNIPILHPYNLGWGSLVTVVSPQGLPITNIERNDEPFSELTMVEYVSSYLKFWGQPQPWLDQVLKNFKEEKEPFPPPQLAIGSWGVAAMCSHILFNLATGKAVKKFPEFYFSSLSYV
ncbi:ThiF family adenylyltransferase [Mesonia sp. HuA40]|uniref:ThiF family adenylyltransferase n=1 Tax=Mesonia sp. HuA40 TaxID=2602761 RepID=UPI0011C965BC|nr:ThiF family adenylyltransferase [Mesonia sp. HuA40]TXK75104.1 ThiF family adenylyltransferase [Mesonia sp. HuA40]